MSASLKLARRASAVEIGTPTAAELVAAFHRVSPQLRTVSDRDLLHVNTGIPRAVSTVLGSLPRLNRFRPRLMKLSEFDVAQFDRLRDLTLALAHAHAVFQKVPPVADAVPALSREVAELRDVLLSDVAALTARKILAPTEVSGLRSGKSYKHCAAQVAWIVQLLRDNWAPVNGRSALTLAELEHAGKRAQELTAALDQRDQVPPALAAATTVRQQAFTLLVRAYNDARRAVSYLRWHEGDAEKIAPSLYRRQGKKPATVPRASTK